MATQLKNCDTCAFAKLSILKEPCDSCENYNRWTSPKISGSRIAFVVPDELGLSGSSADYYKLPAGASELGDLIEHKNMNFNVGNIFKAAYRLGEKSGNTLKYDLEKIVWFANRELNRLK